MIPAPPPHYREPLVIGNYTLPSRFVLAPLAGYTNYPFRRSIRDIGGVGLCTTDLVNARAIIEHIKKTLELLATGPDDKPLSVQIFGGKADELAGAARWLVDRGIAQMIDINMGCPVRKVVKVGGGSSLMCDTTGSTVDLVRKVVEAVPVPVTVKMRLGWDDTQLSAPHFAREFEKAGVAAVTIHGRTREQGFHGRVNIDGIKAVVDAVDRMPVFGNGDVMSIADAKAMIDATGCAGLAIGRGALANPWFFRQLNHWINTGEPGTRATYHERIQFMRLHLHRLIEWKGSEKYGCVHFRKVATWYTKALRLPKKVQQVMVMLETLEMFEGAIAPFVDSGPPAGWGEFDVQSAKVDVPSGPISHW
ncbi:tRNA dihydrouridine synthase DusB [soil metagenome]